MSVNKVILVGNVGKDPEVHYIEDGLAVARFPLATSERGFTTRDGREIPERTEWHNVVAWRRLAGIVEKYVKKGTQLYIEGKIRTSSYEDKDGIKRYRTEIYADVMQLLGSKESNPASQGQNNTATASPGSVDSGGVSSGLNTGSSQVQSTSEEPDDDLPF
ncbi:MAG: single-stranded DNA-binding protein [Chlorobi bacterium]|nr:single-stranded DNA-binding protein [Chlorobiota bacterium]